MPSTRPKLILDEDSFQGLLAAAFTIQQYNEREGGIDAALSAELNATLGTKAAAPKNGGAKSSTATVEKEIEERAPAEPSAGRSAGLSAGLSAALCQQCGSPLPPGGVPCPTCDAEIFRPGERLQRTWATMWSISQEQGQGQGGLPGSRSLTRPQALDQATGADSEAVQETTGNLVFHDVMSAAASEEESLRILPVDLAAAAAADVQGDVQGGRVKLRFRRADLYLGLAIFVALVALLWPAASAERSELTPWERVLIAVGIAEAPSAQAEVHYSGDPNIKVWVDTHAALYYCPGDDLFGKSSGGYYTTQHDAQMDRFEPALRRACVP
jgi:hypothetical protein